MLGGAETTMGIDEQFERVQIDKGVAYRQAGNGTTGKSYAAA
jgi:hypothetical protein